MNFRRLDDFALPIVGESKYEKNLSTLLGKNTLAFYDADLILENDNPVDNQAVRVDIKKKTVGYLSREHARQYRERLVEAHLEGNHTCRCKIVGGKSNRIGVWLDLPIAVGKLS